jgi:hypothetical protein
MRKPGTLKSPWPVLPVKFPAASLAQVTDTPCKIWRVITTADDALTCEFYNGSLSTETLIYSTVTAEHSGDDFDFTSIGGVPFSSKCFISVAGSGGAAWVWYES